MFRRLPEAAGETVAFTIDGQAAHGPRRRHRRGRAACRRRRPLPHDTRLGRPARALLHDGRVLRMPRHHRRRRQSPGLPHPGASRACASRRRAARAPSRRKRTHDPRRRNIAGECYDLAIVGAGPAGLAAAATAARAGLDACCARREPGCRRADLSRHHDAIPSSDRALLGEDYWRGAALGHGGRGLVGASSPPAPSSGRSRRWTERLELGVSIAGRSRMIKAREVILATGALERPFPIPGWTLPGVMTAGGAQTALKASGPGAGRPHRDRGLRAAALAARLAQISAPACTIDAILDTTPRANWLQRAAHLPDFVASPYLGKGLEAAAGGARQGAASSPASTARGRGRRTSCARPSFCTRRAANSASRSILLLLHQGVVPNINLVECDRLPASLGRRAALLRARARRLGSPASVPGIAVAGDGAGIAGARRRRPSAAGSRPLARAHALGKLDAPRVPRRSAVARRRSARVERGRAFLDSLYRPAEGVPRPARRHDRVPLRGGDAPSAVRDTVPLGCDGPEPDEGLPALRHGAVPGPAVRSHRHRADRGRSAACRRRPRSATTACARR